MSSWRLLFYFLQAVFLVKSNQTLLQQYLNWAENNNVDVAAMSDETLARKLEVFQDNMKFINGYNAQHEHHQLHLNKYADVSHEEFLKEHAMDVDNVTDSDFTENYTELEGIEIDKRGYVPSAIDWRNKHAVTSVKDEGNCRASYAYATAGAVEGRYAIETGHLRSLSAQQLIECGGRKDKGCISGNVNVMFKYIIRSSGIAAANTYRNCYNWNRMAQIRISEEELKRAVSNGPVAVMIDGSRRSFQHYSGSSIYDDRFCASRSPTHSMLIVGYGSRSGRDYWILKNSWGTGWGDRGYMYLRRNDDNRCGIASYASYPVI